MATRMKSVVWRFGAVVSLIVSSVFGSIAMAKGEGSDGTDWDGGYFGLHVGYGTGGISTSRNDGNKDRIRGFVIGAHGGKNYRIITDLIAGFEADVDYSTIDASCSLILFDWNCELKGILSVRGRVGVVQPQYLPFATAGFAYALTASDSGPEVPGLGVVVGGGVEFVRQNYQQSYRPRIEVLYYNLFGFGLTDANLFVVRTGISF